MPNTTLAHPTMPPVLAGTGPTVLGGWPDDARDLRADAVPAVTNRRWASGSTGRLFWTVFLLLMLTQVTAAFVTLSPAMVGVLVAMRRAIWLTVACTAVVEALRADAARLFKPLLAFMPFFLVGLLSTMLSVEPGTGLVELSLWLVTMLGACLIGKNLQRTNVPAVLAGWFLVILLLSIVLAVLRPAIGIEIDNRTAHGAWRGVFLGKNFLAWYAGFALMLAAFAPSLRLLVRLALGVLAVVTLYFTHSAGGQITTLAVFALMTMFALWRRLGLSRGLQVVVNALMIGFGALSLGLGYQIVLTVMGRDATLTGRTFVWQAYFGRALNSWLIGAGPGSFTNRSLTTQDIGLHYQSYGKIVTPHNMYLATFGEVGLVGIVCFVVPLLYLAFVEHVGASSRAGTRDRHLLPAFALYFLISGLGETHEVFGIGSGLCLILLLRAWQWPASRHSADVVQA